jgi:hypothetical protein
MQQLILSRLLRLIPPPEPTSGLALSRLAAASYFLGDWQDAQATTMEQQLFVGAACATAKVPPALQAPSSPTYAAPNPDPRFGLWAAFDPTGLDPAPALVTPPATLGTGSSTASGAAGPFLDAWGAALGIHRWTFWNTNISPAAWTTETDSAFAVRIISTIARPSTTNYGMAAILDCFFGLNGTSSHVLVQNAASNTYLRYDQQNASALRVGNQNFTPSSDARATGFASGNGSLAGCFVVNIPIARNADQTIGPSRVTQSRRDPMHRHLRQQRRGV